MRLTLLTGLLCLSLISCERATNSCQRAWWDARMVLIAPVNIPLSIGAAVGEDLTSPPWGLNQLKAITWTPLFTLGRHGSLLVFHGIDLAVFPLYLPFGPEPFRLYQTDTFPMPIDPEQERYLWHCVGNALSVSVVAVAKGLSTAALVALQILTAGLFL
ncbi:hypothetical protein JXA47_08345 [Candidatus Sumerlaeota bacterium]|nr:hypothetical protein [Candidatus Sumerlaeota bacterium]